MSLQHLLEGLDPTGLSCITVADLLQMIRAAQPYPQQGFTKFQQNAPNVVADPEMAFFLWFKTIDDISFVPTGNIYYYNGISWEDLTALDGSKLLPYSVKLTALSLIGSNIGDIIQVNSLGTDVFWVSPVNAISNNTLPVGKLSAPIDANKYLLTDLAGSKQWRLIANFFGLDVQSNVIRIDSLVRAGADTLGLYLRTKLDGSDTEWANVDVPNLAATGINAGQSIRRNSSNTAWEGYSVNSANEVYDSQSGAGIQLTVTLTKPVGSFWKTFEVTYTNAVYSATGGGNVSADFTCQTAPLIGTSLTTGATTGAGNGGQIYSVKNSDDAIAPNWCFKGTVPLALVATDTIAVRVDVTLSATLGITSGTFYAKGYYA